MWQINSCKETKGEEFNNGVPVGGAIVQYGNCDYCETEIISVTDNERNSYFPYLGNQCEIPRNYLYSPIVEALRKYNEVGYTGPEMEERRIGVLSFTQNNGNNLVNIHSRLHVKDAKGRSLSPWQYQSGDAYRCLCNNCFKKTYKRVKIKGKNNLVYEITVLPHEDIDEVIKECKIANIEKDLNGNLIFID